MADADGHDGAIKWTAVPFGAVAVLVAQTWAKDPMVGVISTSAYVFGGYMLSPDLDTMSRPYLRWGLLKFIWLPYQWMVPHRSPVSHSVVLGTVGRVLYLVSVVELLWLGVVAVAALSGTDLPFFPISLSVLSIPYLVGILLGLMASSFNHLWMDGRYSGKKKKQVKYFKTSKPRRSK